MKLWQQPGIRCPEPMCPLLVFPVVHGGVEGVEKSQKMAGTLLDTYHGLEPL